MVGWGYALAVIPTVAVMAVGGGGQAGRGWYSMTIDTGQWVGQTAEWLSVLGVLASTSAGGSATRGMVLPDRRDYGSWSIPVLECRGRAFLWRLGDTRFLRGLRELSSSAELERE